MSMFPANPSLGDQITGPSGEVWSFDGVKWTHPNTFAVPPVPPKITRIQAGPGLQGGGNAGNVVLSLTTPIPIEYGGTGAIDAAAAIENLGGPFQYSLGVVDGSQPDDGEVGEYRELTRTANLTQASGTGFPVGTVSLPPGDWDLWGQAEFQTGDNSLQFAGVTLGSSLAVPFNAAGNIAGPHTSTIFAVPAARVLGGATSNITILASWRFTTPFMPSGSPQVRVTTRARRMR